VDSKITFLEVISLTEGNGPRSMQDQRNGRRILRIMFLIFSNIWTLSKIRGSFCCN